MKRIIISLALIMTLCCHKGIFAQKSDGFFNGYAPLNNKEYKLYDNLVMSDIAVETDVNRAPIGSGLLLLGGMALFYATRKRTVEL